ncbi:MAG: hypothetical protein KUG81_03110 [Gammaproteobacteria bacterium]|nr:hypothetical protein [Gammaproteobacteria bacterium]
MEEPKGDKRSKEYRTWKQWKKQHELNNTTGLGDVVESITKATGIKKAVEFIAGKDCGCDERKQKLNKKHRFRFTVVRCFTEDQYNQWTEFRKHKGDVNGKQISLIHEVYEQLFVRTFKRQSCCYDQFIKEIDRVYENA